MKKYFWWLIVALWFVYEKWDSITGTPEPTGGFLNLGRTGSGTGGTMPNPTPTPTPTPTPGGGGGTTPTPPPVVGGSNQYQLTETVLNYSPVTANGVVEWDKFAARSLNPGEFAGWYGLPIPGDASKAFSRGITHVSEFEAGSRSDVPASKRLKMIQANALPSPWSNVNQVGIENITNAQIDAMTDNNMGGGYDWGSIDFEPDESTQIKIETWGRIRSRVATRLKDVHGIRIVDTYDVLRYAFNETGAVTTPQWSQLAGAIAAGKINYGNNVPYFYLDTWHQRPSDGQWWSVEAGAGNGYQWANMAEYTAERKRTEWKWFYKMIKHLQAAQNSVTPNIGWITWGWANSGYPETQLREVRPDMTKAAQLFGLMFSKTAGTGVWAEGGANIPNYPLRAIERYIEGVQISSQHNAMRTGVRQYVEPRLSFDGGQSWAEPANENNKLPFAAAILKGNEILVVAHDPMLYSGTRSALVGYGDFVAPITLRAYDTTVAKGQKETNF